MQVPQYMVLRNTSSDTTAETRNVNQFIDEGGSRHSIGLYSYETVSNKRSSNNRCDLQMVLRMCTSRQSKTSTSCEITDTVGEKNVETS